MHDAVEASAQECLPNRRCIRNEARTEYIGGLHLLPFLSLRKDESDIIQKETLSIFVAPFRKRLSLFHRDHDRLRHERCARQFHVLDARKRIRKILLYLASRIEEHVPAREYLEHVILQSGFHGRCQCIRRKLLRPGNGDILDRKPLGMRCEPCAPDKTCSKEHADTERDEPHLTSARPQPLRL